MVCTKLTLLERISYYLFFKRAELVAERSHIDDKTIYHFRIFYDRFHRNFVLVKTIRIGYKKYFGFRAFGSDHELCYSSFFAEILYLMGESCLKKIILNRSFSNEN